MPAAKKRNREYCSLDMTAIHFSLPFKTKIRHPNSIARRLRTLFSLVKREKPGKVYFGRAMKRSLQERAAGSIPPRVGERVLPIPIYTFVAKNLSDLSPNEKETAACRLGFHVATIALANAGDRSLRSLPAELPCGTGGQPRFPNGHPVRCWRCAGHVSEGFVFFLQKTDEAATAGLPASIQTPQPRDQRAFQWSFRLGACYEPLRETVIGIRSGQQCHNGRDEFSLTTKDEEAYLGVYLPVA